MNNEDPDYVPDPPDNNEKLCQKCGKWKPVTSFYKRGKKSKYYAGYCKSCHTDPFRYEKICCPHCKEDICFFGVNVKGELVSKKTNIITALKKEIKKDLRKKKRVKKQEPVLVEEIFEQGDD